MGGRVGCYVFIYERGGGGEGASIITTFAAQHGLKAQQVQSTIVSGQARAEGPTSSEPRATPWVT